MKKLFFLTAILTTILLGSCGKASVEPGNSNSTEFKFVSLVAQDTVLPINGITTVAASATGSGLTYKWTASYGSFIGSGSSVKWTVCHADKFTITCEVKDDKGNTASKEIAINVQ
jgi:hypothetical protein